MTRNSKVVHENQVTLVIAASLIAAVRTAREENIMPTSPRIICKVADSVMLARMVLKRIERQD